MPEGPHFLRAAAARVGASLAAAYRAVDPDVRRHVAELPLLGLTLLAPGRAAPEPLPDDGQRPVVFVHGLGGAPGNFWPMQAYFRWRGRRRTYAVAFPGGGSLDELGARLAGFLAGVAEANRLDAGAGVDVIAHSMGGLVARLALDDGAAATRVSTLVTLGTPHAGTHAARWAATAHLLALRPGSPLMTRLATQVPWRRAPDRPRLVALWSASDMLLLPPTSAAVDGADNVEMDGLTHYGYLLSPAAWRRVFEALR